MDNAASFSATRKLAEFALKTRLAEIPAEVQELGRGHMLDSLGLMLAGSMAQGSRIVRGYFEDTGMGGAASVVGSALRLPPRFAAFTNGCAVHADDYDDTSPQNLPTRNGGVHASGSVLAAVLATAEPRGASGTAVAEAFHAGVEVACKINHAVDNRHYSDGYHATGTVNVFGTCAAVGRLLGLDTDKLCTALGIAGSQSAGLRENFGTMMKPFHSGHAADGGTFAAELAARGFSASANILESKRGFFHAGGGFDPGVLDGRIANPWAFADPGMWIKPYPCGALNHPAMTLLEDWIAAHDIKPAEVERIEVQTNAKIHNILLHHRPTSGLQGKFSLPFCLAIIMLRRKAGLAEFTDAVVTDPTVQAMIDRVSYTPYADIGPDFTNVTTFLTVKLKDGRSFSERVDVGKGHPKRRMDYTALAGKFRDCAAFAGWPAAKSDVVVEMVRGIEKIRDIRELTRLLVN